MSISISPHSCQSASRAYVSALLYVISFLLWLTYVVIYAGVFFFFASFVSFTVSKTSIRETLSLYRLASVLATSSRHFRFTNVV